MPRGDRTGPAGMGPMTGRAAGYCAGFPMPGYANPIPGRGGFGYGRGFGRGYGRGFGRGYGRGFGRGWGRGFGRGFGWRWRVAPYPYTDPYYGDAGVTPKQEADMLKAQAKTVQEELNAINQRIKDLESNNASETGE